MKKLLFSVALSALTIVAFGQDAAPVKADKVSKTVHVRPDVGSTAGVLNWEATSQTGVNNSSTITQDDGVAGTNIALVDQHGTGLTNISTIKQDGYGQDAYVKQDGSGNWANVDQSRPAIQRNNTGVVMQDGDENWGKIVQTERGNDALIDQIGHYGKATIDQETNLGKDDVNNKAYIFQTSMDPGVQPSAMPRNEAKIAQNGNRQEAQIEQMYGGWGKNYANIRQDDWNNLSGQPGVNNQLAHVKQVGHRNTANVEQDGTVDIHSLNEVVINQIGEDNWAKTKQMNNNNGVNTISLLQNDDFNWANIDQNGTNLDVCVEQNGTGTSVAERNRVLITQTGEGSVAEYEQHGNSNYAKLDQSGLNNYSNVYQNGTGHVSNVTQTGM